MKSLRKCWWGDKELPVGMEPQRRVEGLDGLRFTASSESVTGEKQLGKQVRLQSFPTPVAPFEKMMP